MDSHFVSLTPSCTASTTTDKWPYLQRQRVCQEDQAGSCERRHVQPSLLPVFGSVLLRLRLVGGHCGVPNSRRKPQPVASEEMELERSWARTAAPVRPCPRPSASKWPFEGGLRYVKRPCQGLVFGLLEGLFCHLFGLFWGLFLAFFGPFLGGSLASSLAFFGLFGWG